MRTHGLTPQQLFTWRRTMRRKPAPEGSAALPAFVPAVVEAAKPATPDSKTTSRPPVIELDIEGDSVWIWRGADAGLVTAIIGALKASR